jgi:hypothetical protein
VSKKKKKMGRKVSNKMKKNVILLIILLILINNTFAQTPPVSRSLYTLSPLGGIIVRNLGMEDKNNNGLIDKGADEGYEGFIEKYGNGRTFAEKEKSIDCGFHADYVIYGAGNARLEENEIVNFYYLNIRFKHTEETAVIDNEIKAYAYANNLPLVWLDDEEGTVINAVTQILGEGWNEKEATIDEAVQMFNRAMRGLKISARPGLPNQEGGYYTLPEFIKNKEGYCTELAQCAFWFFSELKINCTAAWTFLTSYKSHELIKLSSGRLVDYFGSGSRYSISRDKWYTRNPLQSIGLYYLIIGEVFEDQTMLEQSVVYDKYNKETVGLLMHSHYNNPAPDYKTIIELGEFYLQNSDIYKIINAGHLRSVFVKNQIKGILGVLLISYSMLNNKPGIDRIESLLNKHYAKDTQANDWIRDYKR